MRTAYWPVPLVPSSGRSRCKNAAIAIASGSRVTGQVLRSSCWRADQPGAGAAAHRPRRGPQAVGPGRPHRHRPSPLRPGPQRRLGRIRLHPGRELPGIPGVRTPARPDVGPI